VQHRVVYSDKMEVFILAAIVLLLLFGYLGYKYAWKNRPPTIARRYEFEVAADLLKEISTKWERPYHTLPVHVDIPRLAKKIVIYGNGVIVHRPPDEEMHSSSGNLFSTTPRVDNTVRDIIVTLSGWLGEPKEKQEEIFSQYSNFFGGGDPSLSLTEFLDNIVGPTSKVVNVLKACNQSILAPGVLKLKVAVGNQYPFKDVRGSWRIDVHIYPDGLNVTHLKRERSFEDDSADYFEFDWSLKLVFDRDVAHLKEVYLYIDALTYGERMDSSKKKKIRAVMSKFSRTKLL